MRIKTKCKCTCTFKITKAIILSSRQRTVFIVLKMDSDSYLLRNRLKLATYISITVYQAENEMKTVGNSSYRSF